MDSPCSFSAGSKRSMGPRGDERGRRLMVMLERSCDDCKNAKGAHEAQGQVASFPCFGPVSPCYWRPAGPPRREPGAPVSCFPPVAYGQITGAGLCPMSCFSPVIYRDLQASRAWTAPFRCDPKQGSAFATSLAATAQAPQVRHILFQLEPERVCLVGDLAASDRVDRRHHAAVAAEHAV